MASNAEQCVSRSLRTIVADLPNESSIVSYTPEGMFSKRLLDFFNSLEFYLPEFLRRTFPEWEHESLDGFCPLVARKIGDAGVEMIGLCILITDQSLTPIHLHIQASSTIDEVSWLRCKLGEACEHGMRRTPWSRDSKHELVRALERRADTIAWVYDVGFGTKRF
jgi:hypothetical protein